jgi:Amt family ammonium transporter
VDPWAAAVIGIIAGVLVIEVVWVLERRFKLDDPVGAIAVHGVCGSFGALTIGIFANGEYGAGWNLTDSSKTADTGVTGFLYDGGLGFSQFLAQLIAVAVIWTVMFGLAFAFFSIQNKLTKGGIRSSEDDEMIGLDITEMGVPAYGTSELQGTMESSLR